MGRPRAVPGPRAGCAEHHAAPAVCPGRHAGIRQAVHVYGYLEHDSAGGLHDAQRETDARLGAARVDDEDARRSRLRRRRAERALPPAPAVCQSQRRHDRVQSAGSPGCRRVRAALRRRGRRRQRGRPDEPRAESRVAVRQGAPHRSARQEQPQREVWNPGSESIREDRQCPGGGLCVRHPQYTALRLGSEDWRDVHVGYRPEHRRGSEPDAVPARTSAGTSGKAATGSSAGRR